jgi:type IV secretory pathway VirB10-like protein
MEIDMESQRIGGRVAAVAGGFAILAMVGLTASCAKEEEKAPETTTTTTTTTTTAPATTPPPAPPPPAPTEKSINPTGGNLFTPPVYAPPAPTAPPGVHRNN